MNNIYVDELPKNCEKCPCYSYSEGFCNCECWYQKYGEIKDVAEYTQFGLKENERPADCPLKLITDIEIKYNNGQILHSRDASLENKICAEERKKVVQEIKDKISDGLYRNSYGETFINGDIYEILDQIERGE